MTVVVSFVTPKALGSLNVQVIGACRAREDVTVPGTTTETVRDGEIVIVCNGEDSMIAAACGASPDADETGIAVPAGTTLTMRPAVGEKINIKAVS